MAYMLGSNLHDAEYSTGTQLRWCRFYTRTRGRTSRFEEVGAVILARAYEGDGNLGRCG